MSNKHFIPTVALMMSLCCALSASVCHADFLFHVSLNTSPLMGLPSPPSPFAIEFELTDGGGTADNTATISNFAFGGGSPMGSPTLVGGASGSLSGTVTLTDAAASGGGFLNTFTQEFTPGNTLDFDVQLTTNVDTPAPDAFSFALLDSGGNRIPTLDTFGTDFFFTLDLNSANPPIQTFATDTTRTNIAIAAPTVTFPAQVVPEPTTLMLVAIGLAGLVVIRRRWGW